MRWRDYQISTYIPDDGNVYLHSAWNRRFLSVFELVYGFLSLLVFILALLVIFFLGVVFHLSITNLAFVCIACVMFSVVGWVIDRFIIRGKAPIRCSHCSCFMQRDYLKGDGGDDDLFYVCHSCKRYIYASISNDEPNA